MPFRPRNETHAIQEVGFVLTLERNFEVQEIQATIDAHDRWRELLPKIVRTQSHTIVVGPNPLPPDVTPIEPISLTGVSFDAMKRDGSLDWRLKLDDNWIAVNCLSYTRWQDIWGIAKDLLSEVSSIVVNPGLPVVGMALQYIDEFIWEGTKETYALQELFRENSELLTPNIRTKGALWHLNQGWFEDKGLSVPGRRLEKVHIQAVERGHTDYITRIDTTTRHDLANGLPSHNAVFEANGKNSVIETTFRDMHLRCLQLLASLITNEMAQRISLNV